MTTNAHEDGVTVRVFRVYIRATAQSVWDAITDPTWNARYGYQAPSTYDLRPGGAFRALPSPDMQAAGADGPVLDGVVLEADPPRRLVQTWRVLWDPELLAEGFTRVTYELEEDHGVTRLTVNHDLTGSPRVTALVDGVNPQLGGGWSQTLSDLKTLLETGTALYA